MNILQILKWISFTRLKRFQNCEKNRKVQRMRATAEQKDDYVTKFIQVQTFLSAAAFEISSLLLVAGLVEKFVDI